MSKEIRDGKLTGGNGKFGGQLSGRNLSRGNQGINRGKLVKGQLSGGAFIQGKFQGGNCPDTILKV